MPDLGTGSWVASLTRETRAVSTSPAQVVIDFLNDKKLTLF